MVGRRRPWTRRPTALLVINERFEPFGELDEPFVRLDEVSRIGRHLFRQSPGEGARPPGEGERRAGKGARHAGEGARTPREGARRPSEGAPLSANIQ